MRPIEKIRLYRDILKPDRLTTIVDVGANPFAGSPPYGTLRRSDCCTVIGFEPQEAALTSLLENARHNDRFLPYAVGDGSKKQLFITKNSGLVSTLRPLPSVGDLLGPWWRRAIEVKSIVDVETHRLDDIDDVERIDFLKIDIQGGELDVFCNARLKLRDCAVIQTEVCVHPYYEGQPSFGDVQAELYRQGFISHRFVEMSEHPIANNLDLGNNAKNHRNQATVADMIFIKNPADFGAMDGEIIKQMAFLSYAVFRSFDLTLRCLSVLKDRNVLSETDVHKIIDLLEI